MVYGHYITDSTGNETFFTEGCLYCQMSTSGQHSSLCPVKDIKIAEKSARITNIKFIEDKDA